MAEFWYNANYHSSLKLTPFEALYGYPPTTFCLDPYLSTTQREVKNFLAEWHQLRQVIKDNLTQAQNRMKIYADLHRQEREFQVGDAVYLKLQPFRQNTVQLRKILKLAARYYGPYIILERVGKVASKLDLPLGTQIHLVFHVSLLKKTVSPSVIPTLELPIATEKGHFLVTPRATLDHRLISQDGKPTSQFLVRWLEPDLGTDSWEDETFLRRRSRSLILVVKDLTEGAVLSWTWVWLEKKLWPAM